MLGLRHERIDGSLVPLSSPKRNGETRAKFRLSRTPLRAWAAYRRGHHRILHGRSRVRHFGGKWSVVPVSASFDARHALPLSWLCRLAHVGDEQVCRLRHVDDRRLRQVDFFERFVPLHVFVLQRRKA